MLFHSSQPQPLCPSLPQERSTSTTPFIAPPSATMVSAAIAAMPRFNASYAVVFIRDGAKKRRDLAYARARDLQRELGVAPGLQCVPSLP